MPPRFTTSDVRRYYDRQTSGFVALGQGAGAIHRAVWGPGIAAREHAFHFVDDRIAQLILSNRVRHIVDLGCGVGSSLCYLAGLAPIRGTGVTLSPVQADLASQRVRTLGLSDRVSIVEGDYGALPPAVGNADLAYAIESFVHAPDPRAFFTESSRILEPGGLLVICDDVNHAPRSGEASRAIDQFRRGWHINALLEPGALAGLARETGFTHESTLDLTSWLEINRPRDRAIAAFLTLFSWLPLQGTRFAHIAGGRALQECLQQGWIRYELSVFRRL
jgi:cyclopropane fatty-acyl-phospholipid synthase-like methyltransferase